MRHDKYMNTLDQDDEEQFCSWCVNPLTNDDHWRGMDVCQDCRTTVEENDDYGRAFEQIPRLRRFRARWERPAHD